MFNGDGEPRRRTNAKGPRLESEPSMCKNSLVPGTMFRCTRFPSGVESNDYRHLLTTESSTFGQTIQTIYNGNKRCMQKQPDKFWSKRDRPIERLSSSMRTTRGTSRTTTSCVSTGLQASGGQSELSSLQPLVLRTS